MPCCETPCGSGSRADVPLGFLLSGGIDSSLVTAIGCKLAGDVRTFTIGFHDSNYDEAPHSRQVAAYLGTRHTELYLDESHFADFLDHMAEYYDEPFADSSLIPMYYLARMAREHVTVALSGDGGDESFCGYPKYRNLSQLLPAMRLPRSIRSGIARALQLIPSNTSHKAGHALRSTSIDDLVRWLVSIWKPDELAQLMPGVQMSWEATQLASTWRRFCPS